MKKIISSKYDPIVKKKDVAGFGKKTKDFFAIN